MVESVIRSLCSCGTKVAKQRFEAQVLSFQARMLAQRPLFSVEGRKHLQKSAFDRIKTTLPLEVLLFLRIRTNAPSAWYDGQPPFSKSSEKIAAMNVAPSQHQRFPL